MPTLGPVPSLSRSTVQKHGLIEAVFVVTDERTNIILKSDPMFDIPADDPICLLQTGDHIDAFFKSLNRTKELLIISIDVRYDPARMGYVATFDTLETKASRDKESMLVSDYDPLFDFPL